MSNELAIFENDKWSVRTVEKDGATWFVAADVAKCLRLANIRKNLRELTSDEAGVTSSYSRSKNGVEQRRSIAIVSEAGLYQLIFMSRKPEARQFLRWVTHEVLPAIRKHGYYHLDQRLTRIEGRRQALHLENKNLKNEIAELKNQIEVLQIQTGQHATTHTVSQDDWINFKFYPQAFGPIGMLLSRLANQYELPPRKIKRGMREVNAYNEVLFAMFKLLVQQEQIRIGNRKPRRRS